MDEYDDEHVDVLEVHAHGDDDGDEASCVVALVERPIAFVCEPCRKDLRS